MPQLVISTNLYMLNLQEVTQQVCELSKEVGAFIAAARENFEQIGIEEKGEHDLVTSVDKTAEQKIVQALTKLLPEAGFIAEEGTAEEKGNQFNWIIDPIDGTTNFIHGIPCYSVSIALIDPNKQLLLGVVYEITHDECFYAWKGGGSYLNGKAIQVSKESNLNHSLLATGFPYNDYQRLTEYLHLFENLLKGSRGLRRLGSAAVDLAYVAAGRFEAFYEYSLHPWDIAAGILIIEEAGGKVTDFQGGNNYLSGNEIIASNSSIHSELQERIQRYF